MGRATAVALLGRDDGARAQLRQSLEELGASVVYEGETAGIAPGQLLERAPSVVIVNLADGADEDLDHLQPVFDAPDINVVFNESDVSSRLQGWDLARWARHLAAKVLGEGNAMPPVPPGAQTLPDRDPMPTPGAPPTPAQLAPERPIEEFVIEADAHADALPDDFLPLAPRAAETTADGQDEGLSVDALALDDAMVSHADAEVSHAAPVERIRIELEPEPAPEEIPEAIPLPDLGELDRALEASALEAGNASRSDRELLDEVLGGLDLDFVLPADPLDDGTGHEAAIAVDTAQDAGGGQWQDPNAAFSDDAGDLEFAEWTADTESDRSVTEVPEKTSESPATVMPYGALYLEGDAPQTFDDAMRASEFAAGDIADGAGDPPGASVHDALAVPADWSLSDDPGNADEVLDVASDVLPDADFEANLRDFGFTLDDDFATATEPTDAAALSVPPAQSAVQDAGPAWALDDVSDLQFDDSVLDDDVAALAAQLDAMEDVAPRFGDAAQDSPFALAEVDTDTEVDTAPGSLATDAKAAVPPAAPSELQASALSDIGGLELTALDAEIEAAPRAKLASGYDFSAIDGLSLEPIEDASSDEAPAAQAPAARNATSAASAAELAPATAAAPASDADITEADVDSLLLAMGLGEGQSVAAAGKADIPRVIVLGASIGGPDAVRTFLGGIPADFPALFLLAQHLENGYFERLAQQLQKATPLKVRALSLAVQDVSAGDVLVVPADARYTIERNGSVDAAAHARPPRYTPCIDDVIHDAVDRFGADATVIIFSGMAGDAIEGAAYATGKGAEVWVQDPSSCVVSSMVDGARARGVVEFVGSPRELAERCVSLYGK